MIPSPRSLITIDLGAVRSNTRYLRAKLPAGSRFLAAVKADAYGHGMRQCAEAAIAGGADGLAVATAEEAIALRDTGFHQRIIVMGPLFGADQCEELIGLDVEFAVVGSEMARMVLGVPPGTKPARVHLKIDSGMNRQGLLPAEVGPLLEALRRAPWVEVVGVMTHFACATEDPRSVDAQLKRFLPCVRMVKSVWPSALAHAANSAATMYSPHAHFDMVRCGIAVYGLSPGQGDAVAEGLTPALSWTSRVALVKPVPAGEGIGYGHTFRPGRNTRVAIVPLGYADGLFRLVSDRGHVLIRGHRCPFAGRVSMDSFAVVVGEAPGVEAGDTVTLLGSDGDLRVTAEDMAGWAETINYEVTCRISIARAQRHFMVEGATVA